VAAQAAANEATAKLTAAENAVSAAAQALQNLGPSPANATPQQMDQYNTQLTKLTKAYDDAESQYDTALKDVTTTSDALSAAINNAIQAAFPNMGGVSVQQLVADEMAGMRVHIQKIDGG
jgi:hypothetical protein